MDEQTAGKLNVYNGAYNAICPWSEDEQPKAKKPAPIVNKYERQITVTSILPAPLPKFAIDGVTIPITNNGTMNFNSWAKRTLKVFNILTITSGATIPKREPSTMAISTFAKSPNLIFFTVLFKI